MSLFTVYVDSECTDEPSSSCFPVLDKDNCKQTDKKDMHRPALSSRKEFTPQGKRLVWDKENYDTKKHMFVNNKSLNTPAPNTSLLHSNKLSSSKSFKLDTLEFQSPVLADITNAFLPAGQVGNNDSDDELGVEVECELAVPEADDSEPSRPDVSSTAEVKNPNEAKKPQEGTKVSQVMKEKTNRNILASGNAIKGLLSLKQPFKSSQSTIGGSKLSTSQPLSSASIIAGSALPVAAKSSRVRHIR